MLYIGVSTTSSKGRRWCPAISIFHYLFVVPLPEVTLKEPSNYKYKLQHAN
ncbi:unnamed protein product, partial [Arabidopsis halleri]